MTVKKLSTAFAVSALTGWLALGVTTAGAEEAREIKSASVLGSCSLKIAPLGGSTWSYQPAGKSRTVFTSFYPLKAGELWMTNTRKAMPNEPLMGGEPIEPDETLLINFSLVEGKAEPISYVYDNVKLRKQSRQALQPETCRLK